MSHIELERVMRTKNNSLFDKITEYVDAYFDNNGRSPTTREIESAVKISRQTVHRYLKVMSQQGEIEYEGHRSIITPHIRAMLDTTSVQMGSTIPCGELNEVVDNDVKNIRMPKEITGDGDFFLLSAKGTSMINAGIDNGDLVLIKKQSHEPSNGKIVAFLYDGDQTTLKRYRREKDAIYLCPENDTMQPIVIKGQDRTKLRIQGVAVRVIKELD